MKQRLIYGNLVSAYTSAFRLEIILTVDIRLIKSDKTWEVTQPSQWLLYEEKCPGRVWLSTDIAETVGKWSEVALVWSQSYDYNTMLVCMCYNMPVCTWLSEQDLYNWRFNPLNWAF